MESLRIPSSASLEDLTGLVHGELYLAIKRELYSGRKDDPISRVEIRIDQDVFDEGLAKAGKPGLERGKTVYRIDSNVDFNQLRRLTHYLLVYFVSKPRQFIPIWITCFFARIVFCIYRHREKSQLGQNHRPVNFESHFPNLNNIQISCIIHQIVPNLFLFS